MFDGSGFTGLKQRDTAGICACSYHKCPAGGAVAPGIHLGPVQKPVVLFHQFLSVCWDVVELVELLRPLVQKWGSKYFQSSGFWGSAVQQHLLSLKEAQSSEHLTFCLSVSLSVFLSVFLSSLLSSLLSFFLSSSLFLWAAKRRCNRMAKLNIRLINSERSESLGPPALRSGLFLLFFYLFFSFFWGLKRREFASNVIGDH